MAGQRTQSGDSVPDERVIPPVLLARVRVPQVSALPRERVDARLVETWRRRVGLVVAPAGSGKTTLLARFAETAGVPVAWYRAESRDAAVADLLRYLETAFRGAVPATSGGWRTVEDAVAALEPARDLPSAADRSAGGGTAAAPHGRRVLLVVDDLHTLD